MSSIEDGRKKGTQRGLASSQADGSEPPRARVPHPSPRAGAPDEAPSGAREHPPPRRARRGKGFPSAPDDKGGPAGSASEHQEDHGDGRPGTVQSWFRQLDTLGLSALLKDAGRELFNRDIYRWREVADVANELLDQETMAARRRLVEQMTSGSGVRKRTERHADVALIPCYLSDEVGQVREEQLPIRGIMSTSRAPKRDSLSRPITRHRRPLLAHRFAFARCTTRS